MDATDGSKQSHSPGDTGGVLSDLDPGCAGGRQPTGHLGAGGGWHCGGHRGVLPDPGDNTHLSGPGAGAEMDTGKCVIWAAAG